MAEIDTETLILAVKKQPALYDRNDPFYFTKRKFKARMWIEACKEVFEDWDSFGAQEKVEHVHDIQKRWKSLRTCFSRELAVQKTDKMEKSIRTRPYKKRKRYEYFNAMSFLLELDEESIELLVDSDESLTDPDPLATIKNEPSMVEPPMVDPPMVDPPMVDPVMVDPPLVDPPMVDPPMVDPPMVDPPMVDPPMVDPPMVDPPMVEPKMQTRVEAEEEEPVPATTTAFRPMIEKSENLEDKILDMLRDIKKDEEDEDRQFMLSLVPSIRKLNSKQKFDAKIEILRVLKNITFQDDEQTNPGPGHSKN